jgi:hypothetical protein
MFNFMGHGGGWGAVLKQLQEEEDDMYNQRQFVHDGPALAGAHESVLPDTLPDEPQEIDEPGGGWKTKAKSFFSGQSPSGYPQSAEAPPLEDSAGKMAGWGAAQLLKMFI